MYTDVDAAGESAATLPDRSCEQALRLLFAATDAKSARLIHHIHPAWVQAALPGKATWATEQANARISVLLGEAYRVRWPSLDSLRTKAHRLALLGGPQILQILATVWLYLRRAAMRRCVDREVRSSFRAMTGEPAYEALLQAPLSAQALAESDLGNLGSLSAEQVAAAGYAALHASGFWTCKDASVIARLSLSPDALDWLDVATDGTRQRGEIAAFLERLPHFFPEQSWMFGSDMDRALSA